MKHTKKRALLTAIAMLVISAVVLSSATFAWFMAGTTAQVSGITASVQSASSVQVSATGLDGSWTNSLSQTSLDAVVGNVFPSSLVPVSTKSPVLDSSFFSGELKGDWSFTSQSLTSPTILANDNSGPLVKFTFYIKVSAPATVIMTGSSIAGTMNSAVYTSFNGTVLAGDGSIIAYPAISTAVTGHDGNNDSVIQASEVSAGSVVNVTPMGNLADQTLVFTAGNLQKTIVVYMWLEGQDTNCAGTVSASDVNMTLQFALQP